MKLWLDDERPPPKGWVHAKTAAEAIHFLAKMRDAPLATDEQKKRLYGYRLDYEDQWREHAIYWEEFWTITEMSFDHDLADVHYDYWYIGHAMGDMPKDDPRRVEARARSAKEMTGYDVLLWMAEHEVWPTDACMVHTHNPVGADKMCGVINRYGPYDQKVRWTPYVGLNGSWA
jgi:hypothetical protein